MGQAESASVTDNGLNVPCSPPGNTVTARVLPAFRGFQIRSVSRGSAAHRAGLEPFFDCIVDVDGTNYTKETKSPLSKLTQQIQCITGDAVKLIVYNIRTRLFRDVWITTQKRGGTEKGTLMGVALKACKINADYVGGLQVLSVAPNSPASFAGLSPMTDFLLGTAEVDFHTPDDLKYQLRWRTGIGYDPLTLIVYNSKIESVRTTVLRPSNDWGGKTCCGMDIGSGLLHRIPPPLRVHPVSYAEYPQDNQSHNSTQPAQASDVFSHPAANADAAVEKKNTSPKERESSPLPNNAAITAANVPAQPSTDGADTSGLDNIPSCASEPTAPYQNNKSSSFPKIPAQVVRCHHAATASACSITPSSAALPDAHTTTSLDVQAGTEKQHVLSFPEFGTLPPIPSTPNS